MAYLKPQSPVQKNSDYVYPLTTADQIILTDGSRLEKDGVITVDKATSASTATWATGAETSNYSVNANNADNAYKLENTSLAQLMLKIYPIGAIYISMTNTDPGALFGGTWQAISGRFLLGTSGTYTVGSTGGVETTNHASFLPGINSNKFQDTGTNYYNAAKPMVDAYLQGSGSSATTRIISTQNVGGTIGTEGTTPVEVSYWQYTSTNMPPYLAVYMWQRTA